MDETAKIEFKVDEQYENEKGVFKVISIQRDQMVIRWEDGEEIRTEVELQQRIAERRLWEKQHSEAQSAAKSSRKPASARKKSMFPGFVPTDFKKSVAGTTWRSRSQLGAAVTKQIDTTRFKFNSWAAGRKPEMHVQDVKRRDDATTDNQAKLFVRVDERALCYGFRIARPGNTSEVPADWDAFCSWLAQEESEQMLRTIAEAENLAARNLENPASAALLATDKDWRPEGKGQKGQETMAAFINQGPETAPFDLELSTAVDKSEAVASGRDIAADIARLFTRLLPLYAAAVAR